MSSIIVPDFLKPGDLIGIIAPAGRVIYEELLPGIETIQDEWEFQILEGSTLKSNYHQFAASDKMRQIDLQYMLDRTDVKAIIAARGGYGCTRILDQLSFEQFRIHPKWIVGFSDVTALLAKIYQLGYASIHAPMVKSMMQPGADVARESLYNILIGEVPEYAIPAHPLNRMGSCAAQVVGGNVCLLAHLLGSETELDTTNKILILEDVGEYYYSLDRMLLQLKRAGKLKGLAGLVVGQFTEMKDNPYPQFGKTANEIVQDHVAEYHYPVCYDFPFGHVSDNRALPIGMMAQFEVSPTGAILSYTKNQSSPLL
jgi:muramoyltetrapeptide carboxypeptidase